MHRMLPAPSSHSFDYQLRPPNLRGFDIRKHFHALQTLRARLRGVEADLVRGIISDGDVADRAQQKLANQLEVLTDIINKVDEHAYPGLGIMEEDSYNDYVNDHRPFENWHSNWLAANSPRKSTPQVAPDGTPLVWTPAVGTPQVVPDGTPQVVRDGNFGELYETPPQHVLTEAELQAMIE